MLTYLDFKDFKDLNFDILIDARSPKEYKHSHIKDALNLPSLSDEEHEEVGIIHKSNKHLARSCGAAYVCKNMQKHIDFLYKNYKLNSTVGLYCARGGQRSKAQALILDQIGYKVFVLKGGYKAYRAYVNEYFKKDLNLFFINLCGKTGVGKSELLAHLKPSLDLEGLANHYGSSFGSILGPQPSQKSFEDSLFWELQRLLASKHFYKGFKNPAVFIEAESKKIGSLQLPNTLSKAMQAGLHVWCECLHEARVKRIAKDYEEINEDFFLMAMKKISPFIEKDKAKEAKEAFFARDLKRCITILLKYYDTTYKKPLKTDFCIHTDDIQEASFKLLSLLKGGVDE